MMTFLSFVGVGYLIWLVAAFILTMIRNPYARPSRAERLVLAGGLPVGFIIFGVANGWKWLFKRPTE
jgi:hypothetical protein